MYEIENCYKIIFEAMLEEPVLERVAQKISSYANVGIAFLSSTGKLLACCDIWKREFPKSAGAGHLMWADFERFQKRRSFDEKLLVTVPVNDGKRVAGLVSVVGETDEDNGLLKIGELLAQNLRTNIADEPNEEKIHQPLKENMISWALWNEDASELLHEGGYPEEYYPEGGYIAVLLSGGDAHSEEDALRLKGIWNSVYLYEEAGRVFALFYRLTEKEAEKLCDEMEERDISCCVSEMFSELKLCRSKKAVLKRMASVRILSKTGERRMVRRERDWLMRGLYTYTASMFLNAGLQDYAIDRLIAEDEKNHTELYHTLKIYLLCGTNAASAAKKLHIHRNTLTYRLKQIKECMGVDIGDGKISREILAFMMMKDAADAR